MLLWHDELQESDLQVQAAPAAMAMTRCAEPCTSRLVRVFCCTLRRQDVSVNELVLTAGLETGEDNKDVFAHLQGAGPKPAKRQKEATSTPAGAGGQLAVLVQLQCGATACGA